MTTARQINITNHEFWSRCVTYDHAGTPHATPAPQVYSEHPNAWRVTGVINAPATKEDRRPK